MQGELEPKCQSVRTQPKTLETVQTSIQSLLGNVTAKRIALYRSSAFEQLGHKHGVTYCTVIPPSQYIKGQHAAYIQFPLNIMSVKTQNVSWYCAGSNWM